MPPSAEVSSLQVRCRNLGVATSGNGLFAAVTREMPLPITNDGCVPLQNQQILLIPDIADNHALAQRAADPRAGVMLCSNTPAVLAGRTMRRGSCGAAACSCCGCMGLRLRWAPGQQQPCHACLPSCAWMCRSLHTGCGMLQPPSLAQPILLIQAAAATSQAQKLPRPSRQAMPPSKSCTAVLFLLGLSCKFGIGLV